MIFDEFLCSTFGVIPHPFLGMLLPASAFFVLADVILDSKPDYKSPLQAHSFMLPRWDQMRVVSSSCPPLTRPRDVRGVTCSQRSPR